MSAKQQSKAAAACFKLGQSTLTASNGCMTVPTTPGGGKSPIRGRENVRRKHSPKQKKIGKAMNKQLAVG